MAEKIDVDRQLLYGLLALHNHFIERPMLIAALRVWMSDRSKPLAKVLSDQGTIDDSAHPLLEALVAHHLKRHGNDSKNGLAALDLSLANLDLITDPDLPERLASIPMGRTTEPDDPYATRNGPLAPAAVLHSGSTDLRTSAPTSGGSFGSFVPTAGRFRILRLQAKRGLGQVSVAMDEELRRQAALKEIQDHHADHPEYQSSFVREAVITGKLEHPGIIPVYGLNRYEDGRPFLRCGSFEAIPSTTRSLAITGP